MGCPSESVCVIFVGAGVFGEEAFDLLAGEPIEVVLQADQLQCPRRGALDTNREVEFVVARAGLHLYEQPYPGGVDERDPSQVEDQPSEASVELLEALEQLRGAGQAQLATHVDDHGLSVAVDVSVE